MKSLGYRLAGFGGLPLISMITPLLVLPVLGRIAGKSGWASLATGESIGTFAAIVIAYGWNVAGPPRIALTTDRVGRATLYRESLVVRGALAVVAVPVIGVLCVLLAADGYVVPTVLMGLSGAVTGLSFAWYSVGAGDPRSIAVYEAIPRVVSAALAAGIIVVTRQLAVYPLMAATVSLGGILLFSRRTLRGVELPRLSRRDIGRLLVRDKALAGIDVAGGAYATVPVPLVSAFSIAAVASSYASSDKLYKFGLYIPITLGNAFQSWTVEGPVSGRARRLRTALAAHILVGLVGWAFLTVAGPPVSALLFGSEVASDRAVCFWLGATFLIVSTRISLTRHLLVPIGHIRVVFVATVVGAVCGVPLIGLASWWIGPVGAALGLLVSEILTTGILAGPALRYLASLRHEHVPPSDDVAPGQEAIR